MDASKPEVDVNSRDGSGRTPLSYAAAAGGYLDVVQALMAQDKLDPASRTRTTERRLFVRRSKATTRRLC